MASASTLVSTTDNKSGQCPRPPRLRPSPPDDRQSIDDNNNSNNRMTNPRINTIHSVVIVSDTGPPAAPPPHPPIPNSARKNPSSNCNSSERIWWPRWDFSFTSKLSRQSVGDRWLALILLLVMLSALPNSCSSAATIHHHPQSPSVTGRGGRGPHRHHNNNNLPSTTTTTTTTTPSRILNECPWLEWESNSVMLSDNNVVAAGHEADVAGTRAYMAPVVFEGKARSRSDGPVYRVTFDVVTVYKGEVALTGSQVRLEFKSTTTQPTAATTTILPQRSKSLRSLSHNSATTRSRTLSAGRRISASNRNSDVVGLGSSSGRRRQQGQQQQQQQHHHHHRHQHHNTRECLVTAEIRTGRRYLVFAAHWGPNNFTAFGSPLVHTKKSLKDVRSTLCPRCARSPVAYGLEESVTVKKQQRLILRCRTRGNPVPGVVWYKDGKPLNAASKRVRIKTKRRRSTLRIRCVKEEDAGLYECRPTNVIGTGTASRSKVTVVKVTAVPSSSSSSSLSDSSSSPPSSKLSASLRPVNGSSSSTGSSLWPLIALPCPIDSFCLNGGTCKYYEAVGELVCQCAEGYKGQRCENKDIYNLGKGGKCRGGGGRMVGTKCVPTYGGGSVAGIGGGTSGSLLGPTAAAGWAAVPNSNNQLTWWHWIQASSGHINGANNYDPTAADDGDDQNCGGDDDDD
uniref:Pro-neuregulin-2, membrane-bound n=1 Tax=Daphnia galeata TaxID=27404 RepID=A0A8J2RWA5_9CRUS|nr:unnamed protein product [Daphnia galeata]